MRISDDRYSRDRLRLDLALRFIRHGARTQTIRAWTGLTDDRIRKLNRAYGVRNLPQTVRPRGRSPRQAMFFLRSPRLQEEAAVLASICALLGVLPQQAPASDAGSLPGILRGELLCKAFEGYRQLVPEPHISFEHAVCLVTALARGDEIAARRCGDCGALWVSERMSLFADRCPRCSRDRDRG